MDKKLNIYDLKKVTGGWGNEEGMIKWGDQPCGCDEVYYESIGRNTEATKVLYMCTNCGKQFWLDC